MESLELVTTQELLEEVMRRQDAKEITFLYALASDDGEYFEIDHNLDQEQVLDIAELLLEDDSWEIEDE